MTHQSPPRIILASSSPRRRQLLTALGIALLVQPSNINEDPLPGESPLVTQERITIAKAAQIVATSPADLTIAADTTVLLDETMLNKPADEPEARSMLAALRDREHTVNTCVVVRHADSVHMAHASTQVMMRGYTDDEVTEYIASGDAWDKAGSYAMQHAKFHPVQSIRGCPLNVIGLPLCTLRSLMPDTFMFPAPNSVCDAELQRLGIPCHARACDM